MQLFLPFILLGVPIAFSLGGAVLIGTVGPREIQRSMSYYHSGMFTAVDSFSLMAIPFFVLSGNLMSSGGISKRLIAFIKMLLRRVPAASPCITTVASAFFGAISGSSPATVAAIGGIMVPSMVEEGYEKEDASAIAASSGSLGVVIPPQHTYGDVCSYSKLFRERHVYGRYYTWYPDGPCHDYCASFQIPACGKSPLPESLREKEAWRTFVNAIWALGMPLIILGGNLWRHFHPDRSRVRSVRIFIDRCAVHLPGL